MNENDSINKWSTFTKQIQKNDPFFLIHSKKFNLTKNSKVFTIGSCFARNIEEVLENDFQFPVSGGHQFLPSVSSHFPVIEQPSAIRRVISHRSSFIELNNSQTCLQRDRAQS